MRTRTIILLILTVLWAFSCRDKGLIPSVEILQPQSELEYNVGDTIHIVANVVDDAETLEMSLRLDDNNLSPVGPIDKSSLVAGQTYEADYIIPETVTKSGLYYIRLGAKDEKQTSHDFLRIYVTGGFDEPPTVFVMEDGTSNTTVKKITEAGEETVFSFTERIESTECLQDEPLIFFVDEDPYRLSCYDYEENEIAWEKSQSDLAPSPYHTFVRSQNGMIHHATRDGRYSSYRTTGLPFTTINFLLNEIATMACFADDFVYLRREETVGTDAYLHIANASTSGYISERVLNNPSEWFAPYGEDVLIFEKSGSSTKVVLYDFSEDQFLDFKTIAREIDDYQNLYEQNVWYSSSQIIYDYDYVNNATVSYTPQISFGDFQVRDKLLLVWNQSQVALYDLENMDELIRYSASNKIVGAHISAL